MLQGFHVIIAWQTSHQHWLLNDADAKVYGTALSNALRHFPIAATQKAIDIGALVVAAFNFDGLRLATELHIRRDLARQRQAQRRPQGPAQVFQFRPQPPDGARSDSQARAPGVAPADMPSPPPPAAWSPDMTYEPDLGIPAE